MENQATLMGLHGHQRAAHKIVFPKPVEIKPAPFPWIVAGTCFVVSYFVASAVSAFQYLP